MRFQPESNFTNYLQLSNLSEAPSELEDFKMLETLLIDHEKIIIQMRKVVDAAEQNKDEGTVDLIGEYIRELEKTSWMMDAWIIKNQKKQYS